LQNEQVLALSVVLERSACAVGRKPVTLNGDVLGDVREVEPELVMADTYRNLPVGLGQSRMSQQTDKEGLKVAFHGGEVRVELDEHGSCCSDSVATSSGHLQERANDLFDGRGARVDGPVNESLKRFLAHPGTHVDAGARCIRAGDAADPSQVQWPQVSRAVKAYACQVVAPR
jgi:hypothetical protein